MHTGNALRVTTNPCPAATWQPGSLLARTALGAIFLISLIQCAPDDHSTAVHELTLHLTEAQVTSFPDSFALAGVASADNGTRIYWSYNQAFLHLVTSDSSWIVASSTIRAPIAAGIEHDRITVLDSSRMTLLTLAYSGEVLETRTIQSLETIVSAVASGGTWWVLGLDTAQGIRLIELGAMGERSSKDLQLLASIDKETVSSLVLSRSYDGAVAISDQRYPFSAMEITGSTIAKQFPVPILTDSVSDGPQSTWIAFPIVFLGAAYVRTMVDLSSDRRINLLYGHEGSLIRQTEIIAPISFIGFSTAENRLFAARRAERLELVEYQIEVTPNTNRRQDR